MGCLSANRPVRAGCGLLAQNRWTASRQSAERCVRAAKRGRSVRVPCIKYMACCKSKRHGDARLCPASTNNTVLPELFKHRGDERSDSVRLQTSLLLDDCKHGGGLHHSGNHIGGIRLLDACSRPGEECFIETFIKSILRLATLGWKKTLPQPL